MRDVLGKSTSGTSGGTTGGDPSAETPVVRKSVRHEWRRAQCVRCGGICPRVAELRELTVPANALSVAHDRKSYVYNTHFFMCIALDEPVFVGPRVPFAETEVTTSNTANSGIFTLAYIAPVVAQMRWWSRVWLRAQEFAWGSALRTPTENAS